MKRVLKLIGLTGLWIFACRFPFETGRPDCLASPASSLVQNGENKAPGNLAGKLSTDLKAEMASLRIDLDRLPELDPESRREAVHRFLETASVLKAVEGADEPGAEEYPCAVSADPDRIRNWIDRHRYETALAGLQPVLESSEPSVRCRALFLAGKAWMGLRIYDSAAACFQAAGENPHCICRDYALYLQASNNFRAGQPEKTQMAAGELMKDFPEFPYMPETILLLADVRADRKEWDAVLDLLKNQSDSEEILIRRARAVMGMKRWARANALFRRQWIEYPAGRNAEEIESGYREVCSRLNRSFPDVTSRERYERARRMDTAGLKHRAAEIYHELIRKGQRADLDALCRLYRAKILYDTRQNDEALAAYDAFLSRYPGHPSVPTVLTRKSIIYRRLGDENAYFSTADQIIRNHRWSERWADVVIGRGETWRSRGELDKAAADFAAVVNRGGPGADTARWKTVWIWYDRKAFSTAEDGFQWFVQHRKGTDWEPQALYWKARCLENNGNSQQAETIYRDIATRFAWTYSGFRAGQRLGMSHSVRSGADSGSVSAAPEIPGNGTGESQRAMFLEAAGFYEFAAREWERHPAFPISEWILMRSADCHALSGNYLKARRLTWERFGEKIPSGAISVAAGKMVYPLPPLLQPIIDRWARTYCVDPHLIAALILQESGFDPAAFSENMAAGYMQIMPELFERMSGDWDGSYTARDRFVPELNIRGGVRYLGELLKRYRGSIPMALAAYNAGEHRVDAWREDYGSMAEDEWVEHIPFHQTRLFVKLIMGNVFCYAELYGPPSSGLETRPESQSE